MRLDTCSSVGEQQQEHPYHAQQTVRGSISKGSTTQSWSGNKPQNESHAGASLPPTADSMRQHIKRVNHTVMEWKQATKRKPYRHSPIANGWHNVSGEGLKPQYMTQPASPHTLDLTTCNCKSKCTKQCKCVKEGLPCTTACGCGGTDGCNNLHKLVVATESDAIDVIDSLQDLSDDGTSYIIQLRFH